MSIPNKTSALAEMILIMTGLLRWPNGKVAFPTPGANRRNLTSNTVSHIDAPPHLSFGTMDRRGSMEKMTRVVNGFFGGM